MEVEKVEVEKVKVRQRLILNHDKTYEKDFMLDGPVASDVCGHDCCGSGEDASGDGYERLEGG